MMNVQKLTSFFLFLFLSIALTGCSDSDSDSKNSVSGNNATPELQISPLTAFDFGTITEGNTASPLEVTITNSGTARLDVASITVSDVINFQLDTGTGTNPCQTASPALDAGISCTVKISFQPTQAGTFAATLEIASNDANSPAQLSITGTREAVATGINSMSVTINQVDVDLTNCPTTSTVTAFVSVTDQGAFPIQGLSLTDFTIQEDAGPVNNPDGTSFVAEANKPISIALVMDNSSSMREIDIAEMDRAAIEIINQLGSSDEAEVIKFDQQLHLEQTFTSDKALLIAAINTIRDNNGTALYDAVQLAVDHTYTQSTDRKAVIVITDGVDNSSTAGLQAIIDNAKAKDIPVFVVALGENVNISALQQITQGSSGEFYEAHVAQNIRTIIEQKLSEVLFFDQYVLNYNSSSTGTVDLTVTADTGASSGSDSRQVTLCP